MLNTRRLNKEKGAMSDIEFPCPRCNGKLVVDESGAGQEVSCPKCGWPIVIPKNAANPSRSEKSTHPPRPNPALKPSSINPSTPPPLNSTQSKGQVPAGLVICPACKGTASKEADRCPHCGHPIKRGFLGKAGTERAFNAGCLFIILVLLALMFFGIIRC